MSKPVSYGLVLASLLISASARADTVTLKTLTAGAMQRMGGYRARQIPLAPDPPAMLKKAPADLAAPQYGVLTLGPKEQPSSFLLALDAAPGKPPRLWVDSNGNGDLTDDPPADWKPEPYDGSDGGKYTKYMGGAPVTVKFGEEAVSLRVGFEQWDRSDPARALYNGQILFFADYGAEGELTLGGKTYPAMLADPFTSGDFRGGGGAASGIILLIDRNGNGRFDMRGELYDIGQPFTVGGVTYEIRGMNAAGTRFEVVKSAKSVPEILPPPDLRVGKPALPFTVKSLDGQKVAFPARYKGKLVLLHFWASWCAECIQSLPSVQSAHAKFGSQGFDVLSVSLDDPNQSAQMAAFVKRNKLPWLHIYDGKKWQAQVARLYDISRIPNALLIDGDTGAILALGDDLRGEKLAETIQKALAAKKEG